MIYLHGMGHFHPENVISNKFLEDLDIGTTEEWIIERVGIRSRRTMLPLDYIRETKNVNPRAADEVRLYSDAQMGAAAARMAIERAGITAKDIGLVISGSSSPQYVTPAQASTVACELDIEAPCIDLHAACTTFGMQLRFLDMMQPERLPPYVLFLNIEGLTQSIDYSDRNSAVLFGDASAATVVSTTVPSPRVFTDCFAASKPSLWTKVMIPHWDYFRQDGHAIQGFAIRQTTDSLKVMKSSGAITGQRFLFVGHQANFGVLCTACERLGIPAADHWHNVQDFGNVGCAGAPSVLSQHWKDLRAGDQVAVALVGAGLSWTRALLTIHEAPL
jgi:3-oxoacyl-[acyl-carrier-protein] synthase-3